MTFCLQNILFGRQLSPSYVTHALSISVEISQQLIHKQFQFLYYKLYNNTMHKYDFFVAFQASELAGDIFLRNWWVIIIINDDTMVLSVSHLNHWRIYDICIRVDRIHQEYQTVFHIEKTAFRRHMKNEAHAKSNFLTNMYRFVNNTSINPLVHEFFQIWKFIYYVNFEALTQRH